MATDIFTLNDLGDYKQDTGWKSLSLDTVYAQFPAQSTVLIENQRSVSHSLWNLSNFFGSTRRINHNRRCQQSCILYHFLLYLIWRTHYFLKKIFHLIFFTARLPLGFSLHIETWKATWNTINMTLNMSKNEGQMCVNPIVYIIWFNFIYTVCFVCLSAL